MTAKAARHLDDVAIVRPAERKPVPIATYLGGLRGNLQFRHFHPVATWLECVVDLDRQENHMATALIVIDVQNAVLDYSASPDRQPLVDNAQTEMVLGLQKVLSRARVNGTPVFFVQHNESPGDPLATNSAGWHVRKELTPNAGEPIVQKASCDSFHDTDLHERLQAAKIDHLIIGGNTTQFCIDTTCRRAVSLGYDVSLLADCHMTGDAGELRFEQIIAHHNATLNGFAAGRRRITVTASPSVLLA